MLYGVQVNIAGFEPEPTGFDVVAHLINMITKSVSRTEFDDISECTAVITHGQFQLSRDGSFEASDELKYVRSTDAERSQIC